MSKLIDFDVLATSDEARAGECLKTFWRTDGWTEYGWIVLKLAEPEDGGDLIIDRIEFNNDRSAFVEIFASNESPEFESQFCVLKPVFSTLSPNASRDMLMGGLHRKHFQVKAKDFATKDNTDQQHSAKYLKFVCSQPFNKSIAFGLGNIQVYAHPAGTDVGSLDTSTTSLWNDRHSPPESSYQSDWKQHKTENDIAMANARRKKLEELEKSVKAKKEHKPLPTPSSSAKKKMPEDIKAHTPSSSSTKKRHHGHPPTSSTSKIKRPVLFPEDSESPPPEPSTSKKPKQKAASTPKVAKQPKPFHQLLRGVTFAMSGFPNPLRGQIREKALAMGAKYLPDWDPERCTHLVCAYPSTPKFYQAQLSGGRIVSHLWIEDCFITRKSFNWRNFMLGTYAGPSSPQHQEDEEEDDSDAIYDMETDEEDN